LSSGPPPREYIPLRSGFGAGTKDFRGRANALRLILAETTSGEAREELIELVCDIDDMNPECLAAALDHARERGALDVTSFAAAMKQGRHGTRVEVLCRPADATALEDLLLSETTTIGVRRRTVQRRAIPRSVIRITVLGHEISAKVVELPNGTRRAKPEFADVQRAALATGRPLQDISRLASAEAERHLES
jgi:uncharacterized protein (DUF111 family)